MLRGLCRKFPVLEPLCESRCASCSRPIPLQVERVFAGSLCSVCANVLARRSGGYCSRCGELAASAQTLPAPCGECLKNPPPWGEFFFHGVYGSLLRDLILRFKNGHELSLGNVLGRLLADHPGLSVAYDVIIPMPLHSRRLLERGFNQAQEAARPLAARHCLHLAPERLVRTAFREPQTGLSLKEREKNVQGVFAASGVSGMRILLVDDIATTGATLRSATKTLLRAGASGVSVAVIARTPAF